jgi:hypothetical protein
MTDELNERAVRALERIAEAEEERNERKRRKERNAPRLGDSHNEIRRRWGTGP